MRKIIVSEFISVDGVMEAPDQWSFPYWSDEASRYKLDELMAGDALLLGRVTYDGFAAAWPDMTDPDGFADRMNGLPKYVVSTTIDAGTWNNTHIITGDLVEEISRLKEAPGQDILVAGSADLVRTLVRENLIDEYRLMVFPVIVGAGKRLFDADLPKQVLSLVDTLSKPNGVTVLTYHPAEQEPDGKLPNDWH